MTTSDQLAAAPTPTTSSSTSSNVTLRFGGVTSLNDVIAADAPRRDPGRHRPERRRQDVAVQLAHRRLHAAGGLDPRCRAGPGDAPVSVLGMPTHKVNHLGVARTFQNIRLFPALTALENVKVGVETRQKSGPDRGDARHAVAAARGAREHRAGLRADASASAWRRAPTTSPRRWPTASSAGSRSPARWAPSPGVILLDEPAAGTNPAEKRELADADQEHQRRRRHRRAADRARHEAGHVGRRPHRRAELRAEDRRGHAGGDPARPGRHRGLPRHVGRGGERARPSTSPSCTSSTSHRATHQPPRSRTHEPARGRRHRGPLRRHPGAQGDLVHGHRGRDRRAARCERRRQDDDAEDRLGHAAPVARRRSSTTASGSTASRRTS